MKVLQVIPSLGRGGAERLVLNLSEQLQNFGHEVLIVQLQAGMDYPELQAKLNIKLVESGIYYSLFGKSRIETSEFDKTVDEFKPDIIHSHLLDAELVSRHRIVSNVVYITHWHGCPSLTQPIPFSDWLNKESFWKWNVKRILKRQYTKSKTHFLCISDFIGNYVFERMQVEKTNLTIIHNAVDLNLFKEMNIRKIEGFRLISIGSLQKNKNHRFLFDVVQELSSNGFSDIYLDIYGDGPEKKNLQDTIDKAQLGSKVKLHGVVSDPQHKLNQSHILVHSAWHEPFGLVFIEAMACGIPVISFNTGGPAELISDGENGYLVEKDDLNGFVKKVISLYSDRVQLEKLGKNAVAYSKQFGLKQYAQKVEKLYLQRLTAIR